MTKSETRFIINVKYRHFDIIKRSKNKKGKLIVAKVKKKLTSLDRSNSRHLALRSKHMKSSSEYDRIVKATYHSEVVDRQIRYGRKLTSSEKQNLYRANEHFYFN